MSAVSPRIPQLLALLERSPADTFLLYALALEHKKAGQLPAALQYLQRVIQADPAACEAYHQTGQIHEMLGDLAAARAAYAQGNRVAGAKGDNHARAEMQAALDLLG